jgi:hypothetical protein
LISMFLFFELFIALPTIPEGEPAAADFTAAPATLAPPFWASMVVLAPPLIRAAPSSSWSSLLLLLL